MDLFSEQRSAQVVAASFVNAPDPRLRSLLTALTEHLHAFIKEVHLTEDEWAEAVDFLTRTGKKCDSVRQEFVLLSDVLGLSMLVETINHRTRGTSTESTVLGPFHMVESPPRRLGENIALDGKGEPCLVTGQVTGPDGVPLAGALVDVWQANAAGYYDVQQPDVQPKRNLRGLFTADHNGRFWFRTIVPRYYPIPVDGPVGRLLAATGRHPNRPAHIHFIVTADGYRPVTTHLFVDDSPYLDSDAVFGVKDSLVRQFPLIDDATEPPKSACPIRSALFISRLPFARQPTDTVGQRSAEWSLTRPTIMTRSFTYQALPMRVTFGAGTLRRLPDEVAALGLNRVLVLCSPEQGASRRTRCRRTRPACRRPAGRGPHARPDRGRQ